MNRSAERILIIFNPASGFISKDITTSLIIRKLRRHFASVSLVHTNSPVHTDEIIREGLNDFDLFTAFGGDGTVNSVATSLIHTDKTLGILPGGSGNGLARSLNIPISWRRALDTLIHGQDFFIDAGKINDIYFFNVAGIGLDGLISKKFNLESKTRGILPYFYFAFKGIFEMPSFGVRVTTAESEFEDEIMILALANFREYGGKVIIAPNASPYDHLLDLCISTETSTSSPFTNHSNLTGFIFALCVGLFPFISTENTAAMSFWITTLTSFPPLSKCASRHKKKGRISSSLFYQQKKDYSMDDAFCSVTKPMTSI
jgi:diacylglycerol kinase (ATP)